MTPVSDLLRAWHRSLAALSEGGDATFIDCDVSSEESISNMVAKAANLTHSAQTDAGGVYQEVGQKTTTTSGPNKNGWIVA